MITAIVQFQLPNPVTVEQAKANFEQVYSRFRNVPGLVRKYFLLSEDGQTAGGVYLWNSQEDADKFYTPEFKQSIVERYGFEPVITYFESPVIVDNLLSETLTTKA